DFIFSVLSEELGFIGSFGIIFFYFLMIWHEIKISLQAKDKTGCLIATGIVSMFLFHVMENIGMNLGIMPVAGIPLPFISFGGTAMVANLSAIGIISNIWIHHQKIMF
ncbi:MAG TPA: rod shape-determining protein RodA, partial [Firmicutes bacterium]|nr:rod shape-determining protein RodA [Bacillota bacterium]